MLISRTSTHLCAGCSKCGGVSVLITLIRTSDDKLQKYGLGGLKRLVYNSRESTAAFVQQVCE